MDNTIFTIDIGTSKIAAFITKPVNNYIEISEYMIVKHNNRAVRAGQIHDIEKVAGAVSEIKNALEKKTGTELKKVSTAIAGRNLKCFRSTAATKFDVFKEITHEDIKQTELSAIQSVISSIEHEINDYYFIGSTVIKWEVDNDIITHPIGHQAYELKVEIITTFLPRKVLESLFSVLKKAKLEISYLTLEPIAAAEAVLPKNLRNIPIILIDIGAGTSDIAVISKGSIQSFGMIPVAGDSITECICSELLVEFSEAERVKNELGYIFQQYPENVNSKSITFKDIFGKEHTKNATDIFYRIQPSINQLAQSITEEIQNLGYFKDKFTQNYGIVLVGGGSLTPRLDQEIASIFKIPAERIGRRTPSMVNKFTLASSISPEIKLQENIFNPQTSVSFGLSSLTVESPSIAFIHIMVNDKKFELLNFQGSQLNVFNALVLAGLSKQKIYGRPGLAKTFTLNGELKAIKGEPPKPAVVSIDNNPVDLDTQLKEGDRIGFVPAVDGMDASAKIGDIIPPVEEFTFIKDGIANSLKFPFDIFIKDKPVSLNREIRDRDDVRMIINHSLKSILASNSINLESLAENKITLDVNGNILEDKIKNYLIKHNNRIIENLESIDKITVNPGDIVEFKYQEPDLKISDFISVPESGRELKVMINGEEFVFPGSTGKILLNGKIVDKNEKINDGDIIRTVTGRDAEAALVDIFKYISVDPKDTLGKRLKLFVNQQEANFTTPLTEGADVKVCFE